MTEPTAAIIRSYASTASGQLHYREAGTGHPIVLIHKTPSSSVQYSRVLPILADRYRAIALDTLGFGQSDPPAHKPTMHDYAQALIDFLDALDLPQVTLVGHHTGAHIALEAAIAAPERVERLIISGLFALDDAADRPGWREYFSQFRFVTDSHGSFLSKYPLPMLERDFSFSPDDPERYLLEAIAYLQGGPNFWWAYDAMIDHRPYDLFEQLRTPTFFLNQTRGRVFTETREAHAALPGSVYLELVGKPQMPMDSPDEFAAAIVSFIEGGSGG